MPLTLVRMDTALSVPTALLAATPVVFGAGGAPISDYKRSSTPQTIIQDIPFQKHVTVPLGDQGPQLEIVANVHGYQKLAEMRAWWPGNTYLLATQSTLDSQISVGDVLLLDNIITTEFKGYYYTTPWWQVRIKATKEWSWKGFGETYDMAPFVNCPLRVDGTLGVTLQDIGAASAVTIKPYQLQYQMNGQKEIVAIPSAHHVQLPLGTDGPYVTISAHVREDVFEAIADWDRQVTLKCNASSYVQFDTEALSSYYARYQMHSLTYERLSGYAAASLPSGRWWDVAMTLVRYWDWEVYNA